jgi:hypothetical protein
MPATDPNTSAQPDFYADMAPMRHLSDLTDMTHYRDVPDDWFIALTDVRGSTKAIEAGKYKDVNSVAAASITAVLNCVPDTDIPFVFGGDGASLVVPPQARHEAGQALLAVQQMAQQSFGLALRVGVVPVRDVLTAGYPLKVAKLRLSEDFQQPVFTGGGISYAEDLIKDPATQDAYAVTPEGTPQADFSGYECRWNQIPGKHGEVVSLLVQATADDPATRTAIYQDVFGQLEAIYGDVQTRHPIDTRQMRVAFNPLAYRNEISVKQGRGASFGQMLYLLLYSVAGWLLMRFQAKTWQPYKSLVSRTTDHEKFDDMLRMTISGTADQRNRLTDYLAAQHAAGRLIYGVHVAEDLLMTCLIFDRFGRQVHFVDGADGGYAQAARQLKAQMKAQTTA